MQSQNRDELCLNDNHCDNQKQINRKKYYIELLKSFILITNKLNVFRKK